MGNFEVSISSIVMVVGAILAIVSIFLTFTTIHMDAGAGLTEKVSGLDLIGNKLNDDKIDYYSFAHLAPLFIAIFALAAAIMAIAEGFLAGKVDAKVFAIATAVVAAIALIFAIVYLIMGSGAGLFTGDMKEMIATGIESGVYDIKLGFGAWLGFIGSLLAVGGAGWGIKERL